MPPVRTHIHPHTNQQRRSAGAAETEAEAEEEETGAAAMKAAAAADEERGTGEARARETNTHAAHTCRPVLNVVEDNTCTAAYRRHGENPHAPYAQKVATQKGHLVVEKISTTSAAARHAGSL